MKKLSIHKLLPWMAVILWMMLIFALSHQPASDSGEISSGITKFVIEAVGQIMPMAEADFDLFEHIVRKNAHFFIYLVFGILVVRAFTKSGVNSSKAIGSAIVICVLYAMSDEFHQLFIAGRSGEIHDVLIDGWGAVAGIVLYWLTGKMLKRNKQNLLYRRQIQG